jgi:hypothetical protein
MAVETLFMLTPKTLVMSRRPEPFKVIGTIKRRISGRILDSESGE